MPLQPFQYQLGASVFGRDTQIPVKKFDIQPYNVNNQDFQVERADELRFGIDSLTPSPVIFQMSVLQNYKLESMSGLVSGPVGNPIFAMDNTALAKLAREWKNPTLRQTWGATVPLLFCDRDGKVRRIYGRPGKFVHSARNKGGESWIDVQAEFRRSDTYAYSDIEYYVGHPTDSTKGLPATGVTVAAARLDGDGDSWIRALLYGPFTNPTIYYGSKSITLVMSLAAGRILEISSYPWARRIVDNATPPINHRMKMTSPDYLDQIQFDAGQSMNVRWTASGTSSATQMYWFWREAYNII